MQQTHLIEWPQTFLERQGSVTVGDIASHLYQKTSRKRKESTRNKSKGRHVKWQSDGYTLIRSGTALSDVSEIDTLFSSNRLCETHFFIYKREDTLLGRNEDIPLFEAVYKCGAMLYRVQKKHLSLAYRKMGRCNKVNMWDILEDGTPYWVDRHCISMMGQRDSKKRYEAKVKKFKS